MLGEVAASSVDDGVPMLLLCEAQNMRYVWPELQNRNLAIGDPDRMPWNVGGLKPRVIRSERVGRRCAGLVLSRR